jgi:FkbM family methyltransferase
MEPEPLYVYKNYIVVVNPIDDSPLLWVDNDFTKANWPNPGHQAKQKKNSLHYVIKKNKNVIDTGAHIGDYGICLACALRNLNLNHIIVYCIEPTIEKCNFMKEICKLNNIEKNVKIICTGLSNKIGYYSVKKIQKDLWNTNTGGWQWTPDNEGILFTTLDNLWNMNIIENIGFCWLDCQWMEHEVLEGGFKMLQHYKPYILMEYWNYKKASDNIHIDLSTISEGTLEDLYNDESYMKILNKLGLQVVNTNGIFNDFLLEFK